MSDIVLPQSELLLPNGGEPPRQAKPEPEPEPEPTVEAQQITLPPDVPCVLILRVPGEQPGQENIQIAEIGGMNKMDPLSIPTVLRLAAKIKEQQVGIGKEQ